MKRFRFASLFLAVAILSSPFVAPPQAKAAAISITAANFVPSANAVYLPGRNLAAVTITAGQAVYLDTSLTVAAGQVKLASATGSGLATQVIGLAANGASAGQPVRIVIRDPALTLGGAVTAGCIVILHSTAGAVTLTAGDLTTGGYVAVLGVGISTTKINFGGTKVSTGQFAGVVRADVALP